MATALGPVGNVAEHAINYADLGLEIFPVNPADKTPLISQYKATTDTTQIEAWWRQWPHALIGHRISTNHIILDIDPRHGGLDVWKALMAELPARPTTRWHRSGRGDGGGHTWWLKPADKLNVTKLDEWAKQRGLGHDLKTRWTCGIDVLHRDHRYTILPPSPHPDTGQPYEWALGLETDPAPMPALLADLITNDTPPTPPQPPKPKDPDSIADWYTDNHTWPELLTRHGWTLRAGDGNSDGSRWRHPQATAAYSATIRHGCLFVYSPNTPFEPTAPSDPHGYTRFAAYATLEHQGDQSAAAKAARAEAPDQEPSPITRTAVQEPVPLAQAHKTFRRWLGDDYDIDALNATLATAAAERLGGDPLWLLLVSGSGNAKTETVQALAGAGAHIASTISSDGALLSGTPKQQRSHSATGGLLRQIGDRGLLVIKDVTSILSMNNETRTTVLAAIREIHDGHWTRYLGVDGGRTLEWSGRIVIVGAVTTAWDQAHAVIASMGDRFIILRMDSTEGRLGAGRQSRRNVDHEEQMRSELSQVAGGVIAGVDPDTADDVTDNEAERLLNAADLVTLARTGVVTDPRGDIIDAHAPEMPTRFMKQLIQLMRGAIAIGMPRQEALRLAVRCARDSMVPLRLAIIDDLAEHPSSTPTEVRRRLDKPRMTIDRALQALHILGVTQLDEEEMDSGKTRWRYSLTDGIDPEALNSCPEKSVQVHRGHKKRETGTETLSWSSDISGHECSTCHGTHHPPTTHQCLCPGCLANPGTLPPRDPTKDF